MFSLQQFYQEPLSISASVAAGNVFFVSREIAPRGNFSEVVNSTEEKSTPNPDVYRKKRVYSPGNAPYALDFENRLIRRTSGTKTINISYDADGNRVSKTVSDSTSGTTTTYYLVDTNNLTGYAQVFEELYNNGGNLETYRSYTYGLDLIAQHQLMPPANPTQWETSYYMYDGLGTVRALTDDSGLITDAYTYSAFGELLNTQSSGTATPNTYLYTGEQFDSDLGMYFLRARYMNPTTGRFHNMDTFEGMPNEPLSLHKYTYAHNTPTLFVDPTGQSIALPQLLTTIAVIGVVGTLAIPSVRVEAIDPIARVAIQGGSAALIAAMEKAGADKRAKAKARVLFRSKKKECRRVIFHYTSFWSAFSIGWTNRINASSTYNSKQYKGAYATTVAPWDGSMSKAELSYGFYRHEGGDVSWFVALCDDGSFVNTGAPYDSRVPHLVKGAASEGQPIEVDVITIGPNLMDYVGLF